MDKCHVLYCLDNCFPSCTRNFNDQYNSMQLNHVFSPPSVLSRSLAMHVSPVVAAIVENGNYELCHWSHPSLQQLDLDVHGNLCLSAVFVK
jgi:hypothetical protein